MVNITEIWMTLIGVSMALAGLPQIVRLVQRKSAADISLAMFSILLFGQAWWVWYGVRFESPSLVIANSISFMVNLAIISLAVRYRK